MELWFEDEPPNVFMRRVRAWVKANPGEAANVMMACQVGIQKAFDEVCERSADMESALSQSLYPGLSAAKKHQNIREWLLKWDGKCSLKWDWYLNKDHQPHS